MQKLKKYFKKKNEMNNCRVQQTIRRDVFGWFENESDIPVHDPGLYAICPICAKILFVHVITISIMVPGDNRSYFYRVHKNCYNSTSESDMIKIESSIVDLISGDIGNEK